MKSRGPLEIINTLLLDRMRVVGTSAAREASNADRFVERVRTRTGLVLEVVDGESEVGSAPIRLDGQSGDLLWSFLSMAPSIEARFASLRLDFARRVDASLRAPLLRRRAPARRQRRTRRFAFRQQRSKRSDRLSSVVHSQQQRSLALPLRLQSRPDHALPTPEELSTLCHSRRLHSHHRTRALSEHEGIGVRMTRLRRSLRRLQSSRGSRQ